ncbi:ER degradation-enhancing alpha-mannosidase-like protein 2 isoform X5 [Syngnathoides biaculeatus]|uniref:ER degradation-enhancing alpha-mannosidase-like protein 2 isoform X5 n=1 Tax=Syngnathoides biaculeatus TaxID=300417 RepID=UPI002ADE0643|nr:ER degradation-enhancing alpha-mannosidase-like protein 2 isoform X5 [Syngnathoides biaculeatus]
MRVPAFVVLLACVCVSTAGYHQFTEEMMHDIRQRIKGMFYHAYNAYLDNAFPYDELRPLTCDGQDTWGSFSLTLIDALDTLLVLGNQTEFQRVASLLQDTVDFNIDINASVFETNIRVVGGLLSAHLLSGRAGVQLEPGWPCSGPLLRMAEDVARKLLPAFETPTGMPYGTVNLLRGVSPTETSVTCTAGVGTFILEFSTLSRLTGDTTFEDTARRALKALWKTRSDIGLVGNHIDVVSKKWVAQDAGIGAGVDSYFEYLVKGAILLQDEELLDMFDELIESAMYLFRATDDHTYLQLGLDAVEFFERIAKTPCGYASVKDLRDHQLENRMESFFLAETIKYLYLLFDPTHFLHNSGTETWVEGGEDGHCILSSGGYIFNTEAHPLDPAALYCCSNHGREQQDLSDILLGLSQSTKQNGILWEGSPFNDKSASIALKVDKGKIEPPLSCHIQPFRNRLSVLGQVFNDQHLT